MLRQRCLVALAWTPILLAYFLVEDSWGKLFLMVGAAAVGSLLATVGSLLGALL